jgi:hypothetical protein
MNRRADDCGMRKADVFLECAVAGNVATVPVLDEYRAGQRIDRILYPPDDVRVSLLVSQFQKSPFFVLPCAPQSTLEVSST